MRIDRLELQNFKQFESFSIDLNPQFTLLVGENGSGKTSVLYALAEETAVRAMTETSVFHRFEIHCGKVHPGVVTSTRIELDVPQTPSIATQV